MKARKLAALACLLLPLSACGVDKAKSDALGKQGD